MSNALSCNAASVRAIVPVVAASIRTISHQSALVRDAGTRSKRMYAPGIDILGSYAIEAGSCLLPEILTGENLFGEDVPE